MPKGLRLPKAARVMIAIDPDTLKVFKRFADASGISLGRAIGAWCQETADGVPVITRMVSEARGAPRAVMSDLVSRARQHQAAFDATDAGQDAAAIATWQTDQGAAPKHEAQRPGRVHQIRAGTPRPVIRGESPPEKGKK